MADKTTVEKELEPKSLTSEQKRLMAMVEIIERPVEMKPGGQPLKTSYHGVDRHTGETILYGNLDKRKDDLLRDKKGKAVNPRDYMAMKEGWGRPSGIEKGRRGAWVVNANVGIKTRGKEALDIILVETKGNKAIGSDERRWEYHICTKGADKDKRENVLVIPVYNAFNIGVLADIGNAGSGFTMQDFTGRNFQPAKVLRNADNIEIDFPPPAGPGAALYLLKRDIYTEAREGKGLKGIKIKVPAGSTGIVQRSGMGTIIAQVDGWENNWGQILIQGAGLSKEERRDKFRDTFYEKYPLPVDDIEWVDNREISKRQKSLLKIDSTSAEATILPKNEHIWVSQYEKTDSGAVYYYKGDEKVEYPLPRMGDSVWSGTPIVIHSPGLESTLDFKRFSGNAIIVGDANIRTNSFNGMGWGYANIVLVGQEGKKSVVTIEVPDSKEERKRIDVKRHGEKHIGLERWPMDFYEKEPVVMPDGKTVRQWMTENDQIYIHGNVEVRIKKGKEVNTVYDPDKPELNEQSGISGGEGMVIGGLFLAAVVVDKDTGEDTNRRQFMERMFKSTAALGMIGLGGFAEAVGGEKKTVQSGVSSTFTSLDPAVQTPQEIFPDVKFSPSKIQSKSAICTRP